MKIADVSYKEVAAVMWCSRRNWKNCYMYQKEHVRKHLLHKREYFYYCIQLCWLNY